MPKKTGIAMLAAGAVLILAALLLLLYNRYESARAGQEAEILLASVEEAIRERTAVSPVPSAAADATAAGTDAENASPTPSASPLAPELPVVKQDGYEYIGFLEFCTTGLKLPVMADWDFERLSIAPCRHIGSSRTDDLVIAAHNFDTHFGCLKDLQPGDIVKFTDMDAIVNTYAVVKTETHQPTDVEEVLNSGYDLVLYTCTIGGKTRVTVFCNRTEPLPASPAHG